MITSTQAAELRRLIDVLIEAEIANSWKGGGDPADIPEIEANLLLAQMELDRFVQSLTGNRQIILDNIITDAMAALRYDDANPDVGWGLMPHIALDAAIVKQRGLATGYGVILIISDDEYNQMLKTIMEKRQ